MLRRFELPSRVRVRVFEGSQTKPADTQEETKLHGSLQLRVFGGLETRPVNAQEVQPFQSFAASSIGGFRNKAG